MNTELLLKAADYIREEPSRFIMGDGIVRANSGGVVHDGWTGVYAFDTQPPCGTACCIAGAVVIVARGVPSTRKAWVQVEDEATELLGLTLEERGRLFYFDGWRHDLQQKFAKAETAQERVEAGLAQIEYFISQHGGK